MRPSHLKLHLRWDVVRHTNGQKVQKGQNIGGFKTTRLTLIRR